MNEDGALEQHGDCRHHWRIESANGPTSPGICTRCGAQRQFFNSTEDLGWETASERGAPHARGNWFNRR